MRVEIQGMEQVQDFYPLSPLQEGMLFQTLYAPHSGVYVTQLACVLGSLNVPAVERAWRQVVERHAVLRTFFVWKDLEKPIQVVLRRLGLSLDSQDWRDLAPPEQAERLQAYLSEDRTRGYELSKAPLMRLALMQLNDGEHQFVWSFHHLLLDGWSVSLLFKDLFAAYSALCGGQELQPPAARPYRDYIAWLQKQDRSEAESFWRRYMNGFTTPTPLPFAAPAAAPDPLESAFAKRSLQLSPELTGALQFFAKQHQLTLSAVVHAAWALLLNRHSGSEDVVFGTVVSGRPADLPGAESMVGLFINTLPVRVRVSQDDYVLDWIKQLQHEQVQARQYEYISLLQIKEWSNVARKEPLFESAFVYENYPVDLSLNQQVKPQSGLSLSRTRLTEQVDFPLSLMVVPGQRLTLNCFYDGQRYTTADAARLLEHYQTILESILEHPEQKLASVRMLPYAERRQLLFDWNRTRSDYPAGKCAHELFEAQAAERPEATALVMNDERLSYLELNRRANRLAHHLRRLGVGPESRVGIMLERSFEMVVAALAVLKAGGAYVPLDPRYPARRNAFMIQDALISALLTQQGLLKEFSMQESACVCLDSEQDVIAQESVENLRSDVTPSDLAYIIYTSGSTGLPKGVMVQHQGLCNLSAAQIRAFDLRPDLHVLQFASLSFDASIFEIVMALCAGASLYLSAPESLIGGSLIETLQQHKITNMTIPPSVLATLPAEDVPSLQTVIVAGEACPPELVERWGGGRRFFNAYGPTETTVWATVAECLDGSRKPTIGRPIANTQLYLLDSRLEPAPVGVTAELYIAGAGLARGYFNRPELTAERFIPHPFSEGPGARLYRTGDLGRYLPGGEIDFIGRADHQVKLRGFRIELGEIETALEQHPSVQSAAVIARAERLTGYVVPVAEVTLSVTGLRIFLQERLPHYLVPHNMVVLEHWPLTPNGKIDRKALPDPESSRPALEVRYLAPQTDVERAIAQIWQEALNVEQVGVQDNFFDLGGDSLRILRVQSKVQGLLKKEIPLIELFEHATVRAMAEHFTRQRTEESTFEEARERASKQKDAIAQQKQRMKERSQITRFGFNSE